MKYKRLTLSTFKLIKLRMDRLFPTSRHLSYTVRYRLYKSMPKTPPKRTGMGLMFPFPNDDQKYFHWYLDNFEKKVYQKTYFKNRFLHIFSHTIYKQIKGTKAEKFSQLKKLLSEKVFGLKTNTDKKGVIKSRVNVMAKIITLVGEGYLIWAEFDGHFYSRFEKLSTNKSNLNEQFNYYFGKLNETEQKKLGHILSPTRKIENKKTYVRPSRAGQKQRVAWNKGLNLRKRLQRKHDTYKSR